MNDSITERAAVALLLGLTACGGELPPELDDVEVEATAPFGLDARPANPSCVAFPRPPPGGVQLNRMFSGVTFRAPLAMEQPPGDSSRFFVIERAGRVRVVANRADASVATTALDLTSRVDDSFMEAGLLGLAFHPDFSTNGHLYLYYTGPAKVGCGPAFCSRLSRFTSTDGGQTFALSSERTILEIAKPLKNHNGGGIAFGPDGFLYIGTGDGGGGGDPDGNAQNTNSLLGKFLRIDVDRTSAGRAYAIPATNPFATSGGRPEVYAIGFRNPWRWSFDRQTGALWAGDVGQNEFEEVDVVTRGGNYGWDRREGLHCFPSGAVCTGGGFVDPVFEYPQQPDNNGAVVGGYVYRGRGVSALAGRYVFGDAVSGRLWTLPTTGANRRSQLITTEGGLASFAEDHNGELYTLSQASGQIKKFVAGGGGVDRTPARLSATGCFQANNPTRPVAALIPYDVNSPLWSDGLSKRRWLAIPDGRTITVSTSGDWNLPIGSVLVKEFSSGTRRIETRLLVRHDDGDWAGYTYKWNAAGTDALLLAGGEDVTLPDGSRWSIPDRADCLSCHSEAAGRSLGLETAQLNRTLTYPTTNRTSPQLATLEHIGMFSAQLVSKPPLPRLASAAPVADRARAYLHSNCSHCHRLGGPSGRATMDLRFTTTFANTRTCRALPQTEDLGVVGGRLIVPGNASRSLLSVRMHAEAGGSRMPPLGTRVVDDVATDVVDAWIAALNGCN